MVNVCCHCDLAVRTYTCNLLLSLDSVLLPWLQKSHVTRIFVAGKKFSKELWWNKNYSTPTAFRLAVPTAIFPQKQNQNGCKLCQNSLYALDLQICHRKELKPACEHLVVCKTDVEHCPCVN